MYNLQNGSVGLYVGESKYKNYPSISKNASLSYYSTTRKSTILSALYYLNPQYETYITQDCFTQYQRNVKPFLKCFVGFITPNV